MQSCFVLIHCRMELCEVITAVLCWPDIQRSGIVSPHKYIRQIFTIDILKVCIHSTEKESKALTCFPTLQVFIFILRFFPQSCLHNLAHTYMTSVYVNKIINAPVPALGNEYIFWNFAVKGQPCHGRINRHKYRLRTLAVPPQLQRVSRTDAPQRAFMTPLGKWSC